MSVYVAISTIGDEDRIHTLWYSFLYHVSLSNVDADTDNKLRSLYLILLFISNTPYYEDDGDDAHQRLYHVLLS